METPFIGLTEATDTSVENVRSVPALQATLAATIE
jgi:hypothetical protein